MVYGEGGFPNQERDHDFTYLLSIVLFDFSLHSVTKSIRIRYNRILLFLF